jgi:histidine decarboxylase
MAVGIRQLTLACLFLAIKYVKNIIMQDEASILRGQYYMMGYPCNTAYDYSPVMSSLKYLVNNVGDPFSTSSYHTNTKRVERDVLAFFAELWGFERGSYWGYLSASGTVSNLNALFVAREAFPTGVLYASADSHYSVAKAARILKIPLETVRSQDHGEMDYEDFEARLKRNIDFPAIVNANFGTTMRGAVDDTNEIHRILQKHGKSDECFIHADAALAGMILPFVDELNQQLFLENTIHSVSLSGHKFFGIPTVCSVFVMLKRYLSYVNQDIEIIRSNDATLMGSRSGHSALFFEHAIKTKGLPGFRKDVIDCVERADLLVHELNRKTNGEARAWRNRNSTTVVCAKPSERIVDRWQLATEMDTCHAVVMPSVTESKIRHFVREYGSRLGLSSGRASGCSAGRRAGRI